MRIASRHYSDDAQLAELDRRLAQTPDAIDAHFERACCLEDLGAEQAAAQAYLAVLQRDPRHLGALINLGLLFRESGDLTSARAFFTQALVHHPLADVAHVNLAQALLEQGEVAAAVAQFTAALAVDPESFAAHHGLALLYEGAGDAARAQEHLARAFEKRSSWRLPYLGSGPPLRVLLLVSGRGGDVVTHPFLDDRVFETTMIVPDGFRAGMALAPHDVVFNGIGDADRAGPSLERARAIVAASRAAVINHPERVLATGRAAAAARFATIPQTIVPRAELLPRAAIAAADLGRRGWTFPLLLRAPGYHAGKFFERVAEPDGLPDALARMPGAELFVVAFVDTRGPDGYYRKYRALFVDGRIYPVHLAISPDWKVHYFSAGTERRADHRDEERAFLTDMHAVLGSGVAAALEAIGRTLGLDYGGVDFGLDRAGNVVVFEANATMAVYPPAASGESSYRRPAFDAVIAAVRESIVRRAQASATLD